MKLAEISIKRSILAAMMIAALMVFGFFSFGRIGVELFPNVEFPVVTTTVIYPGADPATMELKVADKIEESLQGIGGVKRMTSRNLEGVSNVTLEFELEVDGNQALQDVRDKVAAIEQQLPDGIEPPIVQKFDIGASPVLTIALAGDMEIRALTKFAREQIKQRVQQVPGVGTVTLIGGREREIQVLVDPRRMTGHGVTVSDVSQAIQSQNIEIPGGSMKIAGRELTVKTKGEVKTVEEIGDIIIRGVGGSALRVRDVAEVVDTVEEARSASYLNGAPALSLVVRKQSGSNTVSIAEDIRKQLEQLRPELEQRGITAAIPSDQSVFVEHSIDGVKDDLLLGTLLTIIIILAFLHDIRATFIAALAIPTSVVSTFAFMEAMGFSFNNLTMLALSLSIGILVDDAIVVIENIYRHLEMGKPKRRAAMDATKEIGFAVIATTFSIVAVFVPVAYMKGIIGRFFFQFGLTVAAAVLLSMLVSFTLTPMLSSRIMKTEHGEGGHQRPRGLFAIVFSPISFIFRPFARGFDRVFKVVEQIYAAILRWSLRHPFLTLLVAVGALAGSIVLVTRVPAEFIPNDDRSEFSVAVELPTGSDLDTTVDFTNQVADDIRENLPGVRDTFATVGGGNDGQINRGKITVTLVPSSERPFSQHEAMNWVRERLGEVEGANVTVQQISAVGGDSGFRAQPIQFSIRSNDLDAAVAAADRLKNALAETGTFVDLDTTYRGGKPEVAVLVDRNKAADQGVPVAVIAQTVRAMMAGDAVSTLKDGSDVYDITVQLAEVDRNTFDKLDGLKVRSTSGQLVNLASVVRTERTEGPSEIERLGRMRSVIVLADLKGVTLGEAQKIVNELAADPEIIPPELSTGWLGNAEMMVESFTAMLQALLLAIILVYMILAAQFNSLIQPITIMISLPLSVIGAFGGLYLSGMTLNMFSFIGIIMLMGLVTKTAILLVDFANSERESGRELTEALVNAGVIRIRPIFMTTAATIFGMVPVAMALSEGGESRAPMAICVIGGMITSTALTLVVIPVVYMLFERLTTNRSMRWLSRTFFGVEPGAALDEDELDMSSPSMVDITVQDEVSVPKPRMSTPDIPIAATSEVRGHDDDDDPLMDSMDDSLELSLDDEPPGPGPQTAAHRALLSELDLKTGAQRAVDKKPRT
ncbi:MAG: efflux RND transporter permease subunit [Myxococcales bacterium]|nr:efflux RND transporter permease subunit [Myxococcales bacterium]MCB9748371.1 efflux RND transporter permease subunit [Myxococcales bacterium]